MEPITWFTGVVEMIVLAFAYYLFRGSEYAYDIDIFQILYFFF
jgi:hypothetical protein